MRERLNETAERAMAVLKPLKVIITNYPEGKSEMVDFEINPTSQAQRQADRVWAEVFIEREDFSLSPPRYHRLTKGGMVRLKGAYIIRCDDVVFGEKGEISHLLCSYVENSRSGQDTSGIKVKGVIHWVNARRCENVPVIKYYPLLNPDVQEGDFMERLNPASKEVYENALVEPYLAQCSERSRFQFIRVGYYIKGQGRLQRDSGLMDSYKP